MRQRIGALHAVLPIWLKAIEVLLIPFQIHHRIPFIRRPFYQREQMRKERDAALAELRRITSSVSSASEPATTARRRVPGKDQSPLLQLGRADLLRLARSYDWVHTIDLGDGFETRGLWGRGNPQIWAAFDTLDFQGKSVLDIGCWDGQWSFEAERRGARKVVSTDLISQRDFRDQKTFDVAAMLRNSSVEYIPDISVYDIESLAETFDIVLYMGIYYHLKDPLRAFTSLRPMLRDDGQILIEGAILEDPGCFANFYYREQFCGDRSNWWVPTRECLRQWVECSFFHVQWEGGPWSAGPNLNHRHCMVAKAGRGADSLYSFVPENLEAFNVTTPSA